VHHGQGNSFVPINQTTTFGTWALLGRYTFTPGSDGYVQLQNNDVSGDASIFFDAVKWVPVAP
jgi:hypothetical protein